MCLNHPETIPPTLVCRKIVFHKTSPWHQKGYGWLLYWTDVQVADSHGWQLRLAAGWKISPSFYPELPHMASTCALSFTVWWLHSQIIYSKRPKAETAIVLRSRPENWHSIHPAIVYRQRSRRPHSDSRGGATDSTGQQRSAKESVGPFHWFLWLYTHCRYRNSKEISKNIFFYITWELN